MKQDKYVTRKEFNSEHKENNHFINVGRKQALEEVLEFMTGIRLRDTIESYSFRLKSKIKKEINNEKTA